MEQLGLSEVFETVAAFLAVAHFNLVDWSRSVQQILFGYSCKPLSVNLSFPTTVSPIPTTASRVYWNVLKDPATTVGTGTERPPTHSVKLPVP